MLKYILVTIVALAVLFIGFMFSKKIHKSTRKVSRVLDAYLDADALHTYAADFAAGTGIAKGDGYALLESLLDFDYDYITEVYEILAQAADEAAVIPPAAEWILDNYYIIEKNIRLIGKGLDKKTIRLLPVVDEGEAKGFPRIYAAARELVAHTNAQVSEDSIKGFLSGCQETSSLLSDELWMFFDMVKLALIENITYVSKKIKQSLKEYEYAAKYAEYLHSRHDDKAALRQKILRCFRHERKISSAFVSRLVKALQSYGKESAYALQIIEHCLIRRGLDPAKIVYEEQNIQAGYRNLMGNSITSIIRVGNLDVVSTFEQISELEAVLRQDPAGIYATMDADTRELYRRSAKKHAHRIGTTELAVAQKAISLAAEDEQQMQKGHVGYYLLGEGVPVLYQAVGAVPPATPKQLFRIYIGAIYLTTVAAGVPIFAAGLNSGLALAIICTLVFAYCICDICVKLASALIPLGRKAKIIPRLDLPNGLNSSQATFVIVATLLLDEDSIDELCRNLEDFYLQNKSDNLYFAIVGDLKDTSEPCASKDTRLITYAKSKIAALNAHYAKDINLFYLLVRSRVYYEKENKWMGRERKRGAICAFVSLLKTGNKDEFLEVDRDLYRTGAIRYVITLDADTTLFQGSVRAMVGAMEHPLNRAVVDPERGVVTHGYGILQPRSGVDIESANATLFAQINAPQGGVDQYHGAVSDVYQDLFGEGIFMGKGIFDADVFFQILSDAIPDNTVLSHDLLEGSYLRCGYLSDVEVSDGFPKKYLTDMSRQHRWTRGDWQLLPWLGKRIKNRAGNQIINPLGTLSKYKIFDNLRRSIVPIGQLAALIVGILCGGPVGGAVLAAAGLSLGFDLLRTVADELVYHCHKVKARKVNSKLIVGVRAAFLQLLQALVTLPHRAYLMLDALIRALWRSFVSHKQMLAWVTAADAEKKKSDSVVHYYREMWVSPLAGLFVVAASIITGATLHVLALIFGAVWLSAPVMMYFADKPGRERSYNLSKQQSDALRRLARRTWRYFEDFTGKEENYLVPDNYQEEPYNGVAHRTSPTNIGIMLLSFLSAYDFGYISISDMLTQINATLDTIDKLKKWNGHLFNWYDTKTLQVMEPAYVSTVDNGNYIVYVMTLGATLLSMAHNDTELHSTAWIDGILDTAALSREEGEPASLRCERLKAVCSRQQPAQEELIEALTDFLASDFQHAQWSSRARQMAQRQLELLKQPPDTTALRAQLNKTAERLLKIADETSFLPLYDEKRQLFSIGYDIAAESLNHSYYDLLASEARQTSYAAIAKGEVAEKHWFKLGRNMTSAEGYSGLLSWSGTMFEYLMPLLVMKNYKNSLFDETYWFIVREQRKFGLRDCPVWGISESGFFSFDSALNYQYKAFGVPKLRLRRDDPMSRVIAPYASVMALMVDLPNAYSNIEALKKIGALGSRGFYEAIDFTKSRLFYNESYAIVKSYMVHHQAMSFLALNHVLFSGRMQKRFLLHPMLRSVRYLLAEKIPTRKQVSRIKGGKMQKTYTSKQHTAKGCTRIPTLQPYGKDRSAHVMSNKNLSCVLTDRAEGYIRCGEIFLNRWRNDPMQGVFGNLVYVSVDENQWWCTSDLPFGKQADEKHVIFYPEKAVFSRRDGQVDTKMEVAVCADDPAVVYKVTVTNHSSTALPVSLSNYMELALGSMHADEAHRSFANLFVSTAYDEQTGSLTATRRPRSEHDRQVWGFCSFSIAEEEKAAIGYETDREKFIGRTNSVENPDAITGHMIPSNTVGAVLDPVFSLRCAVDVPASQSICVYYTVGLTFDNEQMHTLCRRYSDATQCEDAFLQASSKAAVESHFLALKEGEEEEILSLLPHILYPTEVKGRYTETMQKNTLPQSGLFKFGISGDLPLVLLTIENMDAMEMVLKALKMHEYYTFRGIQLDLVILTADEHGYGKGLLRAVEEQTAQMYGARSNRGGRVFVIDCATVSEAEQTLLQTVACVIIRAADMKFLSSRPAEPQKTEMPKILPDTYAKQELKLPELLYYNEYGGFDTKQKEYVIAIKDGRSTPMPWSNILANESFGSIVTETGSSFTWNENSRENKLTPWYNDPVTDRCGEGLLIRDNMTNAVTAPCMNPLFYKHDYLVRHGMGYSIYSHNDIGLAMEMTVFVPNDAHVKLSVVKITNQSQIERDLSFTYYVRPIMGSGQSYNRFVKSSFDHGILFMENLYQAEFSPNKLFIGASEQILSVSSDAAEFYAKTNGVPDVVYKESLSMKLGTGYDCICAVQNKKKIGPNESAQLVFILGEYETTDEIRQVCERFCSMENVWKSLKDVKAYWQQLTGAIQVDTPDASVNLMANSWLLYQCIASRLHAKSGYYQNGGATGFRDQLQDVLPLMHHSPQLARKQILLHAAHQFVEGDVLHWWHTVKNGPDRGVRTRFSDDLLWLNFVTLEYVKITGDETILDEMVPFLAGEPLREGEDERYFMPDVSEKTDTLFAHMVLALERSQQTGRNGLLLMGSGDWNDGMSSVGNKGEGESVWLSWFVYDILNRMIPLCERRGHTELAQQYQSFASALRSSLNTNAWDADWYLRAFFDNGEPLGSYQSSECKIDAIAQAWSVISGGGESDKQKKAMESLKKYLIDEANGLIRLLTPAFEHSDPSPGYIQGYLPGIRENGGQYTHAAAWVVMALARMGDASAANACFNMINPINHTRTPADVMRYKNEPYAVSADVYTNPQHMGRGGWSFYTGSAGWLYKVLIEELLGIKRRGDILYIEPCMKPDWETYTITYRYHSTLYRICVKKGTDHKNGVSYSEPYTKAGCIQLFDDKKTHEITVTVTPHGK